MKRFNTPQQAYPSYDSIELQFETDARWIMAVGSLDVRRSGYGLRGANKNFSFTAQIPYHDRKIDDRKMLMASMAPQRVVNIGDVGELEVRFDGFFQIDDRTLEIYGSADCTGTGNLEKVSLRLGMVTKP